MKTIHRDDYRNLIEKLIKARKDAGITQKSLAEKLGKPQSYVSKYENRERRLDVIEFSEIVKKMGLEPSSFLD